jgi:hypothetical protein
MGNRLLGILIGAIVFMGGSMLMFQVYGKPKSNPYPKGVVTQIPGTGDWIRPEGSAEQLADTLTVNQLIDRWSRWPQQPRKEGVHLVYAEALALYGEEALPAVEHLAKAVKHSDPNLRRSVMNALIAIGDEGIPPLVKALGFWPRSDPHKIGQEIRWDASQYLKKAAKEGVDIELALPTLSNYLVNPKSYVFTRQEAAFALAWIGTPEAGEVLKKARNWYYAQEGGLSVEENRILKNINIGLRRFRA